MKNVVLHGEKIADQEQLHKTLKEKLTFPAWYGGNLDALYDCLTDIHEETEIIITGKEKLETQLGSYAERFFQVLEDADEENGHLTIRFEEKEKAMKIVILDGGVENPGDLSWEGLEALGELTVYERTPHNDKEEIIRRIGDAEAVIINKVPLDAEVFERCPSIQYVGVLATGYNVVDVKAAAKRNIPVTNVPTYGTQTVAQYTFSLLLEICSHVGHHERAVREGKWTSCPDFCFWDFPMIELAGKTMGIIGAGHIGQAVMNIAPAFGLKVLYNSRTRKPELENENCCYAELDELFAASDIISLHCPLFPETEGIINAENIAKMKDGVFIINTSRGPLVVEQDLANALEAGKVGAAAVDVVSSEPIKADNPLLGAKNCMITPHVAWAAKEARARLMDTVVQNLANFQQGKPCNAVNLK